MPISKINLTSGITGVLPSGNATYSSLRPNSKPIIINGNCAISQKATAITDESSSGYHRVDRMYFAISSMGEGRLQQETLTSGNAFNLSLIHI